MTPLTRSSNFAYGHIDPGPEPAFDGFSYDSDVEMTLDEVESDEMDCDPVCNIETNRLIIAIDFGTTFSSVAYAFLPKGLSPESIDLEGLKCISRYPGYQPPPGVDHGQDYRQDVPTEMWYDDGTTASWRHSSSDDVNANNQDSSGYVEVLSSDDDFSESENARSEFEDGEETENPTRTDTVDTPKIPVTRYWGFEVARKLNELHAPKDEARPLVRFKLNLVNESDTEDSQTELRAILRSLRKRGVIEKSTDIYVHYLTDLLNHTKKQLIFADELQDDTVIQFVLCVPAKWPVRACRIMQEALEHAVADVNFSRTAATDICNLFMLSEPEAAAECILAEARSALYKNETIVVLDAGGGTVDAVTYTCVNGNPVRLAAEVVSPDSKLCGASFINERYEKKLIQKLAGQTYLWDNPRQNKTLKSIVQAKTTDFEYWQKRYVDVTDMDCKDETYRVHVESLLPNKRLGFFTDNMELKRKTMRNFFEPSLLGARKVLENQLDLAENRNHRVERVILTGGFGQSPSLQKSLRAYLAERSKIKGGEIGMIVPKNPSTAVARGAVLRALNKRFGPNRIMQSSYGFIISEPYEPEVFKAHRQTKCRINRVDGERYVDGTIRWVLQQGQHVENQQAFTFDVKHTFSTNRKVLVCAEQLWMSNKMHPDHYRKTHAENEGAVLVGTLETNVTGLRDQGRLQLQEPSEFSTHAGSKKTYWEVHYEIVLIVQGRSINFEARFPVKSKLLPGERQDSLGAKLVGIAAAFAPGTA